MSSSDQARLAHLVRKRRLALFLGVALIATTWTVFAVAPSRSEESGSRGEYDARPLDGLGLHIELPHGWYGRITRPGPGPAIVLQAATVPLAPDDGSGIKTHEPMASEDIFLMIVDTLMTPAQVSGDESWSDANGPVMFRRSDLHDVWPRTPLPSYGVRFLVVENRPLSIYFGFGTEPDDERLDEANHVLGSLRVTP